MEKSNHISQGITKLISFAQKSVARGNPHHNLNTYRTLSGAIENLAGLETVKGDQIDSCVNLLSLMIELQQRVIKDNEIPSSEVPQIYKTAQNLNEIFIKSAKDAVTSGDNTYITEQCEALLQAADQIRSDPFLRTSGILDAKLKDVIGRLREKADIVNLFEGEENQAFNRIMEKAELLLEGNDLDEIGEAYIKLQSLEEKVKNQYVLRANFAKYLTGYRSRFISKIETRMNELKTKVGTSDLFENRDLLEKMEKLEKLEKFHQEPKLSGRIKFFRNKVLKAKQNPIEESLNDSIKFIMESGNDLFSVEYERLYDQMHGENEIFTSAFYDRTLKGMPPQEAIDLLKEKKEKMDQVDIGRAGQADYENSLKKQITGLIKLFESSIEACSGK
ncbi:hypothetical protein [Desulfospira joergensenii]|uniref:hypothetical protein n=1 Tax=Desulfospira joergensenii TaxID=53329 RepID=UPI0003FE8F4A|nr:hypothetical protein [Desulfospira joergensenii]